MKTPVNKDDENDPLLVQSVTRAFQILSAFDAQHSSLGLTQMADVAGLNISATQRFAHTLTRLGYLRKDPFTKRYQLTSKTLSLGYHYTRSNPLMERAFPYLAHLNKATGETVNLTVPDGADIVYISRFISSHVFTTHVIIGTRLPMFCTSAGVAILSKLDSKDARAILERSELKQYTSKTLTRIKDLQKKIATAAKQGYACSFEEYFHGDLSVAAAIMDTKGNPIGAVNISSSTARQTPKKVEEYAPLVQATVLSISQGFNS